MTGTVVLLFGLAAGILLATVGRHRVREELRPVDEPLVRWTVTIALGITVAAAPFTTWRVFEDIRATAPITPEHARYVGAETKLIDGELVQRVGALLPERAEYYVAVAPWAYEEIRTSLGVWMGYALAPRRRTTDLDDAGWIVTWGATPTELGVRAGRPTLVGRNRLVEHEPVYLARAAR